MRRVRALAALALALAACGPTRIPPPAAPATTPARPEDAIPGDLDVVVRVDLRRMRAALGEAVLAGLARGARGDGDARLLDRALERTDTAWFAFRPALTLETLDSVVVLEGKFADLEPRALGAWGPPAELGAGWRVYERKGAARRPEPVRLYARTDALLVLVSTAEIDAVTRSLEEAAGDPHPEPPARGVVSLAARVPALAALIAERSPKAARLLRSARTLSASVRFDESGLSAELAFVFDEAETARRVAAAATLLARAVAEQGGREGAMAERCRVEAVGESMVVRLRLSPEELGALVAP
ncbi:MAG: hypothetical protein OZ921_09820 [Sorangiineae bacterium]|nr:hypothetical protein [Polyangiaceae bacterium]MEB2322801.1 hypothetical protein [Sorangiineae bacterium]